MPKALKRIVGNDLEILARALYETAALSECVRLLKSDVYSLNSHNAHLTSAVSAYRKELGEVKKSHEIISGQIERLLRLESKGNVE